MQLSLPGTAELAILCESVQVAGFETVSDDTKSVPFRLKKIMPKKASVDAGSVNKSKLIRDTLAANPKLPPREIARLITEQGVPVSPAYVSIIKSNGKKAKKTKRVAVRKMGGAAASKKGDVTNLIQAAHAFVQAAGGIDQAKATLDAIAQIVS